MVEDLGGPRGRTFARAQAHRGLRRRAKLGLLALAALGMVTLALPVAAGSAQFVWNATASAPAGLYRIERVRWHTGDRVAVLPASALAADLARRGVLPRGKLLIKQAVAAVGDQVCRLDVRIIVNGSVVARARTHDSKGVSLPTWQGCMTLDVRQVFLLGDTPGSYDGRYFGATLASDIVGRADLLLTF
jgi:conjugative transfer signal peptidase TraF